MGDELNSPNNNHNLPQPSVPREEIKTGKDQITFSLFQGPLPPPDIFVQYESVCPGATARIIQMAEDEAKHRRHMEEEWLKANSRDSFMGIICGFILGFITIIGGVIAIIHDHPTAGTVISGSGLVSLVSVFIYGTRSSSKQVHDESSLKRRRTERE